MARNRIKFERADNNLLDGYEELNWTAVNSSSLQWPDSGYLSVLKGERYGWAGGNQPFGFDSGGFFTFDLRKGHFAAAWDDALVVKVEGFRFGSEVAETILNLDRGGERVRFDDSFSNLDKVVFTVIGATHSFDRHVAFDGILLVGPDSVWG